MAELDVIVFDLPSMDDSIREYANALYTRAILALVEKRGESIAAHMREMVGRGMSSGYGLSGIEYSGMIRIYSEFIGGDMMAQLNSFREAFEHTNLKPSTEDLNEIWRVVRDRYEQGLKMGANQLQQYLKQRGDARGDTLGSLTSAAAHEHDRVLNEWKVWRGRTGLPKDSGEQTATESDPKQHFFRAGTQHDAFVQIREILSGATSEVTIVDSYVDETLWQLLSNVPTSVRIRVLTDKMKGDFALEARKFRAQRRRSVEVRQNNTIHDRFVIADSKCWHVGASIKDAGSKAFMLSEVKGRKAIQAILADIDQQWTSANQIPI
jgi:hypothetical protein